MNEERKPKEYDLVLGNQNQPQADDLVLGGIAGVQRKLKSKFVEERITALSEVLQYGKAGLNLAIDALKDKSKKVQITAYKLLQDKTEYKVKKAILDFNPYRFLECSYELKTPNNSPGHINCSADGSKILYCGSNSSRWNPQNGEGGKVIKYIAWDVEKTNQPYFTYFLFGRTHKDNLHSLYINPKTNTLIAGGNPKQNFNESPFNQIEVINLENGINEQQIDRTNLKVD